MRILKTALLVLTLLISNQLFAQQLTGTINGQVMDAETKTPLMGTNVVIKGTNLGAATDAQGKFIIKKVPIGSYNLQFSYIGYELVNKTDVIVRSQRITSVDAELDMEAFESDEVVVTAGYFAQPDEQPVSITSFSREEIRRAPGSAGDVSRILMSLPSVAKVNDQTNSLIVRGGSPMENAFYIDNIEIPNINHFPTQGASGGPIGMLNVDFIKDVDFHTGGFSAAYGDKLSSIMDINFREGNRDEIDAQVDLNFAGFGGTAEGPLFNGKGSWLVSARRSYLDFLVKSLDMGTSMAPIYGDIQGKIVYDINPNHKLSLIGVFGDDYSGSTKDVAIENKMMVYGDQYWTVGTVGMNWRALWNASSYSNTSLSYTSQDFDINFTETMTTNQLIDNNSLEQALKFRNVNHVRFNSRNSLEFGVDAKQLFYNYDIMFNEYTDALGEPTASLVQQNDISETKAGVFANYTAKPLRQLTTTIGVRADYFSYNEHTTVSPRFSFSYQVTPLTSINGSTGILYQNLPLVLLSQLEDNKKLEDTQATHYVLGLTHLLTENTQLTIEAYQKDYANFPINPAEPSLFVIDELFYRYGFFFNHGQLNDTGKAYTRGLEVTLQKKLATNFYGLVSASYFKTQYQGGDNVWRDRVFDNQYIFSAEGGYKPNNKWEFSMRWIFAGGAPFTPFDMNASTELNRAVLDENRINDARYPDYHSLNIRFDRRYNFNNSNMVFYLSVWNAYNRQNVASYFWNEIDNKKDTTYQWLALPIFGIEYEF